MYSHEYLLMCVICSQKYIFNLQPNQIPYPKTWAFYLQLTLEFKNTPPCKPMIYVSVFSQRKVLLLHHWSSSRFISRNSSEFSLCFVYFSTAFQRFLIKFLRIYKNRQKISQMLTYGLELCYNIILQIVWTFSILAGFWYRSTKCHNKRISRSPIALHLL